jgi:hypothetical protein
MRVSVFPVVQTPGKFYELEGYAAVNSDGAPTYGIRQKGNDYDNTEDCAWLESGSCGKYADFAENTRVSLTLRMGSEMTGWLGAYGFLKKSELINYPALNENLKKGYGEFGYNELINSPETRFGGYDPVGNFEGFATFEPILRTLPGSKAQWVISSGASANGYTANVNQCFNDKTKLLGIVTTNALIYSPNAPEFKDGTLNYKVAGLHHQADGNTLTRGTYDLAIRSDVARCVYGFSDAPFQASISVIGADGQEQTIATESIREDAKREWLFLSAANFTFSSPVIKVKLTQEKKLTAPTSTNTKATASATSTAKKSISCIKGKVIKKISGSNPKCPAGYKKR